VKQATWLSDTIEFFGKVLRKWSSITAFLFFVLSVLERLLNFPTGIYITRYILWGLALVFLLVSLVQVYREQKSLIPNESLPQITIKLSRCSVQSPNWAQTTLTGDFKIVVMLDIRNSGAPGLLSITVATINYDGLLFEAAPRRVRVRCPSLVTSGEVRQPVKIESGDVWPDYSLEIVVPSRPHSAESFIRAIFPPSPREFEIMLDVDVETLSGKKVPHDPISVQGNFSSVFKDAVSRWETQLQHRNLSDRERNELLATLFGLLRECYAHSNDT